MRPGKPFAKLLACIALGTVLRLVGLTRGVGELGPGEPPATSFHTFHPDQATLIAAASQPIDPLSPPLTAYGLFPIHLARAALELATTAGCEMTMADGIANERTAVITVRVLSVLISTLSLALVWHTGARFFGTPAANLATLLTAAAPIAIQQAHFYTIDGLFTLLVQASLFFYASASQSTRRSLYLVAGIAAGLAAATRNGMLLVMLPALAALFPASGDAQTVAGRLRSVLRSYNFWWAVAAGAATLLILQPYLVSDPGLLLRTATTDDFGLSLRIARGDELRPWSLFDVHTTPYLHYFWDLLPLAVGWPLGILCVLAWARSSPTRDSAIRIHWLWIAICFTLIGGLHTKHVRYLLPLLPAATLLVADLICCWWRAAAPPTTGAVRVFATRAIAVVALGCSVTYGIAFAGIYAVEDARIQAGRWLREHAPAGARIGIEGGGFSARGCLDQERYEVRLIGISELFRTRGYTSCQAAGQYLERRVEEMDYIAIVTANRHRQFTSVPEMFPAIAAFYEDLVAQRLGFQLEQRFEANPWFPGLGLGGGGREPSFEGYDHPEVLVFAKSASFDQHWKSWLHRAETAGCCSDEAVRTALDAAAADSADTDNQLIGLPSNSAHGPLLDLVRSVWQGYDSGAQERALEVLARGYQDPSRGAALLPWATALSLEGFGLETAASRILQDGAALFAKADKGQRRTLAASYIEFAQHALERDRFEQANRILGLAMQVSPSIGGFNLLAASALDRGLGTEAVGWWQKSLALDDTQAQLLGLAGKTALATGDARQGLAWLARSLLLRAYSKTMI